MNSKDSNKWVKNQIEYGNLMGISKTELKQARTDAIALLVKTKELQSMWMGKKS